MFIYAKKWSLKITAQQYSLRWHKLCYSIYHNDRILYYDDMEYLRNIIYTHCFNNVAQNLDCSFTVIGDSSV
jgi:hypothetical protein